MALDALAVVSFAAGSYRFAVQARQIRSMLAEAQVGADPLTAEALIGLPPGGATTRKWLVVGAQGRCVEVGEPVELETLPASALYPLPPPVAARITLCGIRGLAIVPAGAILIVDLEAILP